LRARLHAFLGGSIRTLGGVAEAVGGTSDHVHLLVSLRTTQCLAEVLKDIKQASSAWLHDEIKIQKFAWQEGYGAFTVSPSQHEGVKRYISDQASHHQIRTFQDEYLQLLTKNGVVYDARFLW
jgi:putative NIF3 family GTP cyclohydrolase 1 type 2